MNNTIRRMLRLSLPATMLFVFGCAGVTETILVQDISVELHDQVVEYLRPEKTKGYSYEKIHCGENHKFLLVFCSLRHDGGSQNDVFTVRGQGAVYLEDDKGLKYPSIGRGQNDYREYGRVLMQQPFGSTRVAVSYTHLTLPTN